MDTTVMSSGSNLVTELRKAGICASVDDAESMAKEILEREKKVSKDMQDSEQQIRNSLDKEKQVKEESKSSHHTKAEIESLLGIHNKIIEANFQKLKDYTDGLISDLRQENTVLREQIKSNQNSEQPKSQPEIPQSQEPRQEAPKSEKGFSSDDVSIEKMFYMGNK